LLRDVYTGMSGSRAGFAATGVVAAKGHLRGKIDMPDDSSDKTSWGLRIAAYRKAHTLSQMQLAEMLDVDHTTVSRWERGRDMPGLAIQQKLQKLVETNLSTIDRALRDLIDYTDDIAVVLDKNYRLVRASKAHQKLLNYDQSDVIGEQFPFWTENMFAIMAHAGGPKGWWDNGIYRMDFVSLRKAGERAQNGADIVSQVRTVTVRDSMGEVYRYALTKTAPRTVYKPQPPKLVTFDQAV
jgi:transcriptional regulator with XRE-family HTH domain